MLSANPKGAKFEDAAEEPRPAHSCISTAEVPAVSQYPAFILRSGLWWCKCLPVQYHTLILAFLCNLPSHLHFQVVEMFRNMWCGHHDWKAGCFVVLAKSWTDSCKMSVLIPSKAHTEVLHLVSIASHSLCSSLTLSSAFSQATVVFVSFPAPLDIWCRLYLQMCHRVFLPTVLKACCSTFVLWT